MWHLLAVSLLALLFYRPAAMPLLSATLALAFWQGMLQWPAALLLAGLALAARLRRHSTGHARLRPLFEALLVFAAAALMLHLLPGFHNQPAAIDVRAGPLSMPFTFYYNLDKALAPFVLLAGLPLPARVPAAPPRYPVSAWLLLVAAIPLPLLLATLAGGLAVEPHWPAWLGSFALANLFFVALAEEALFRAWLQQRLEQAFGALPALLLAALLFGLAHAAGGALTVLFASAAGLLYGLAWQWSGRLWVAASVHFALNMTHLLLFTYPALQR